MGDTLATLTIIAVNILKKNCNLKPIRYIFYKKKSKYQVKILDLYKMEDLDCKDLKYIQEIKKTICLLWLCGINVKQNNLCIISGTSGNKHVTSIKEHISDFEKYEINKTLLERYFKGEWDYFKQTAKSIYKFDCLDEIRKFGKEHDESLISWCDNVEKRFKDCILN